MKDYKSLIADIRTEACELADRLKRLEVFMMSEDFCKISPEQKSLLETQYDLMAKYKVTLVKRAYRINYEHEHEKTCTCEPHVLDAMIYEAHQNIKDRQKVPREPPTFEIHPEICDRCIHHKGAYSTCHDCENGSNLSLKETAVEAHHCYNCKHGSPKHSGPGIVSYSCDSAEPCHEGDQWEER